VGVAVRGTDGAELGTVRDIYRVGENDVLVVDGGTVAPFDLPVVRAFIRVFAPRRGEIVVDAESLDLRPAKPKTPDPSRPKAPRRRSRKPATSPGVTAPAEAATEDAPAAARTATAERAAPPQP
jgi:hypothetical protein